MLWKNANHSLFDSISCSKLCKFTCVSDCPRLSLEQFLVPIPQYTSCTYSINNGFKLPLGQNELSNILCTVKLFVIAFRLTAIFYSPKFCFAEQCLKRML